MMDRATRKYLLDKNGITQAEIARKLDINATTVCNVIKGTVQSARVKSTIAKALNMTVENLWPNDNRRAA